MLNELPSLSYKEGMRALAACIRAKVTPVLLGSPGIGKTTMVYAAGEHVGLPVHVLIGANLDPTDVAGFPVVDGKELRRVLLAPIRACVDAPGILFLDEISTAPRQVRAPLLRGLLERVFGDTPLHPDSPVVGAMNPPEQAPGGSEWSAAGINRVIVLPVQPTLDEFRAYLRGTPVTPDEALRDLPVLTDKELDEAHQVALRDLEATLAVEPGLVQWDPPRESVDAGVPFASPRAWDRGLRALAAYGGSDDDTAYAILAGAVGVNAATTYFGVRRLRTRLPSIDEIAAKPAEAFVPEERPVQIAALGVLSRVADRDVFAAWIYASRLRPELRAAAGRVLAGRLEQPDSPHKKAGLAAKNKVLKEARGKLG